jgi:glucokinase
MILIAGDIGGTKTILRLVRLKKDTNAFETLYEFQYKSSNFPDLVPMVQKFLNEANGEKPTIACFAIAGPVINNTSQLTNLNWYLDVERLASELNLERVHLINDFAAVSYGVLGLQNFEIESLQIGTYRPRSPIAVIGAGTGLGEAFLIPQLDNYQVFATEGGHSDFAPRYELEFQLLEYIKKRYSIERVSVERVVSGQGIVNIYKFLRDAKICQESPEIGRQISSWELENKTIDPAAIIAKAGLEKQDSLCQQTMEMFVSAYGAEAGNVALKLLPYGGFYLAGGIAAKILPLMKDGRFLSAFQQKGRMINLLEGIPLNIVLNPQIGLLGSVLYASKQV